MIGNIMEQIRKDNALETLDTGEFQSFKMSGMHFASQAYRVPGLGHLSVLRAEGMLGLMKMDTMVLVPAERNLPLLSYDRIHAMGNDTLFIELYDTQSGALSLDPLQAVKEKYKELPDHDPGVHWYDSMRFPESVFKKGKKKWSTAFDGMEQDFLKAYLALPAGQPVSREEKVQKTEDYVEQLIRNGGPSTDVFRKAFGEEKTRRFFTEILFGTAALDNQPD